MLGRRGPTETRKAAGEGATGIWERTHTAARTRLLVATLRLTGGLGATAARATLAPGALGLCRRPKSSSQRIRTDVDVVQLQMDTDLVNRFSRQFDTRCRPIPLRCRDGIVNCLPNRDVAPAGAQQLRSR